MNTEYEIMLIDQNEANNFISPGWQKDLYKSNINNFVNHLRNGTFREHSVITVKKVKGGKYLLLDGQHKIEAIKISGISAVIDLRIVSGLDDKEMIAEYKAINSLKAPRLIDDIKAEVKGHHNVWLLEILDETKFPINTTLKGGVNAIRLDAVLNIFHNGKAKTLGRNNLSRKSLPLFLEDFKKEELKLIKEFFNFYRNCFGEPFKDNWLYKNIVAFSLMRIWLKNRNNFEEEELVRRFKEIMKSQSLKLSSNYKGTYEIGQFIKKVYKVLNYGRSKQIFEKFWEED